MVAVPTESTASFSSVSAGTLKKDESSADLARVQQAAPQARSVARYASTRAFSARVNWINFTRGALSGCRQPYRRRGPHDRESLEHDPGVRNVREPIAPEIAAEPGAAAVERAAEQLRDEARVAGVPHVGLATQHAELGNVAVERSDVRPRPDEQTLGGRDDAGARRARLQIPDRWIVQVRDVQVHARRAERRSRDEG